MLVTSLTSAPLKSTSCVDPDTTTEQCLMKDLLLRHGITQGAGWKSMIKMVDATPVSKDAEGNPMVGGAQGQSRGNLIPPPRGLGRPFPPWREWLRL